MSKSVLTGLMGFGAWGIILFILLIIGLIASFVFYLITLQNTLQKISPQNRKMDPGQVWLMFIPLFNLGWQFVVVTRIAASLKAEFAAKGINVGVENPGQGIGIAYCVLYCCGIIPFVSMFTYPAGLICWIIYWVKISDFKKKLDQTSSYQ